MESILDSRSNSETSSATVEQIKAASAPTIKRGDESVIKTKISAPSYLFSLAQNEAPPFVLPGKEPKPKLIIGTIMSQEEAVDMIAHADADKDNGLRKFLCKFLVQKNVIFNYSVTEREFLMTLLRETIDYAAQRDFSSFKLACLITIYLNTHMYFKWYYWLPPINVWRYFKELMIRHTIEDSPDGQEVFEPQECYDIVTHFHTVYMCHIPLIHIHSFGVSRIKLTWPFKLK